eukprot:2152386-Pyramimonas_sp.AAC.1
MQMLHGARLASRVKVSVGCMCLQGLQLPDMMSCVLGFRLECATVDPLRTMDEGVASHIICSVLWHVSIFRSSYGGCCSATRVAHLASHLKYGYPTAGVAFKIQ